MSKYEVKDVVCDYGLYEDSELKLILNSRQNALTIKRILEVDESVPNQSTVCNMVEVPEEFADSVKNAMTAVIGFFSQLSDKMLIDYIMSEIKKAKSQPNSTKKWGA